MTSWHSYPKLYNVGHAALTDLFTGYVVVEEKIDGSQFSFGIFDGELRCRSKGAIINMEDPEKLFSKAVATVKELAPLLQNGWTYRGEFLSKPKHNTLAYDRVPAKNIILFDINRGEEDYLTYSDKLIEARRLGLEVVPFLFGGKVTDYQQLAAMLEMLSTLGGQKIEGFVIKNYSQFGPDKKVLMGKHVSEAFKEVHKSDWKERNPGSSDIIVQLGLQYRTPARWNKAIQHLKEAGKLTGTPKDIGLLLKEVAVDVREECREEIIDQLMTWAWPKLQREIIRGLPEWYKDQLLQAQCETLKTAEEPK